MKTVYSIGRDPGCDIYLYDDKNVISRNHAILKIGKGGKYFISDQSMNGTYINGIRVTTGVPVPVTRKDVVTFAHVAELDWDQIPNPRGGILKGVLFMLIVAIVAGVAVVGVLKFKENKNDDGYQELPPPPVETSQVQDDKAKEEISAKDAEIEKINKEFQEAERKRKAAEKKRKAAEAKTKTEEAEEAKAQEQANHVENPII